MSIDWWTLALQALNVLILIWLLARFFWRPVAGMIEQRRTAAQSLLSDAEAKHAEAEAALADIARTQAGFTQERAAISGGGAGGRGAGAHCVAGRGAKGG